MPQGKWKTVVEDMGIPSGKPKTIAVDLTGKFLSSFARSANCDEPLRDWDEIFLIDDAACAADETDGR